MSPPPSSDAGCSVRVAVRVRPLLSFEKTERLGECLRCIPESKQLWVGDGGENGRNTFTFDYTFPKSCEQRLLYDECVASLLEGEAHPQSPRRGYTCSLSGRIDLHLLPQEGFTFRFSLAISLPLAQPKS